VADHARYGEVFFLISKIPLLDTPGLVFVCRQVVKISPPTKKKKKKKQPRGSGRKHWQ